MPNSGCQVCNYFLGDLSFTHSARRRTAFVLEKQRLLPYNDGQGVATTPSPLQTPLGYFKVKPTFPYFHKDLRASGGFRAAPPL